METNSRIRRTCQLSDMAAQNTGAIPIIKINSAAVNVVAIDGASKSAVMYGMPRSKIVIRDSCQWMGYCL